MASPLERTDPELAAIVGRELERQNTTVQLIASENFASPAILEAQGSVLTNKYSEGYPAKRYYGGNAVVDEPRSWRHRGRGRCSAPSTPTCSRTPVNRTRPPTALLEPGDKVMGMRLDQGGHLTHNAGELSGRLYAVHTASTTRPSSSTTTRARSRSARAPTDDHRGATAHSRIDFEVRHRRRSRCAVLVDAAHIAGLIVGGASVAGTVRRHRDVHDAQDIAGAHSRSSAVASTPPRSTRPCSRFAGRSAHARDRGQGRGVPRAAQPDFAYAADVVARPPRRGVGRGRLPHRLGRHRQSPDARRSPALRCHGQGGAGSARPGRHHVQQERDSQRPASPS